MVFDQSGNLFGATYYGGSSGWGTAFELSPASNGQWDETVLWNFTGGTDGKSPGTGVILGKAGRVYGVSAFTDGFVGPLHGSVFELTPGGNHSWTEATIAKFPYADSGGPLGNLVSDVAGNLYGTANYGGAHGYGTAYEVQPSNKNGWKETILYSFASGLSSGSGPSSLLFDAAGNLYGETAQGGSHGAGLVFELSPSSNGGWTEKDLYSFRAGNDGAQPYGGLIFDGAGNLYGTTKYGGNAECGSSCGTVFKVTPGANGQWTETVLYRFAGGSDGQNPLAGLIFDSAGALYGTTKLGGVQQVYPCKANGCGTVFKLSPAVGGGWSEKILYRFTGLKSDGSQPEAAVVIDDAENLYGTTVGGGVHTDDCSTS